MLATLLVACTPMFPPAQASPAVPPSGGGGIGFSQFAGQMQAQIRGRWYWSGRNVVIEIEGGSLLLPASAPMVTMTAAITDPARTIETRSSAALIGGGSAGTAMTVPAARLFVAGPFDRRATLIVLDIRAGLGDASDVGLGGCAGTLNGAPCP